MQRRNFIKNAICLGCLSAINSGCREFVFNDKNELGKYKAQMSKYIYKSKKDLPKKIRLEACSMCQLSCPACGSRYIEKQAPKGWTGYLKFEDFKKFVDDNDFEEIHLSNNGEIFLNPELDRIIEYAYQKNIKLSASVNLNTVSKTTLENLVRYKFANLVIAIDGATPETYSIYRRKGNFNNVVNNIKTINYYKEKYNSEYPKLKYRFIVFGHNEHEIELAKQKAKDLNMEIKFRRNYAPSYSPVKNIKLVEKQTGLRILDDKKEFIKVEQMTRNSPVCNALFDSPQIDYNGTLLGCCRTSLLNFGVNVFEGGGLLKALNSPNVLYAKLMIENPSIPGKKGIPCTTCDDNYLIIQ